MNLIPERLLNFTVREGGNDRVLGEAVSVDLPEITAMTETVSGAGIAGQYESPTFGNFQSMVLTIHWRTIVEKSLVFFAHRAYDLDLRGVVQVYESASGTYEVQPVRISVRGIPKSTKLAPLQVGGTDEATSEFEVLYIKIWMGGEEKLEIDKPNYMFKIDGVDSFAEIRAALGYTNAGLASSASSSGSVVGAIAGSAMGGLL